MGQTALEKTEGRFASFAVVAVAAAAGVVVVADVVASIGNDFAAAEVAVAAVP